MFPFPYNLGYDNSWMNVNTNLITHIQTLEFGNSAGLSTSYPHLPPSAQPLPQSTYQTHISAWVANPSERSPNSRENWGFRAKTVRFWKLSTCYLWVTFVVKLKKI
jgi:hypothetical protein